MIVGGGPHVEKKYIYDPLADFWGGFQRARKTLKFKSEIAAFLLDLCVERSYQALNIAY